MEIVYKNNNYEVREIDNQFYPIQIIDGQAYGVGRDCYGGLNESGPQFLEEVDEDIKKLLEVSID